ncbi:MAG: hypothetical protein ACLQDV_09515 [Candidatus Binataceae bacterium]
MSFLDDVKEIEKKRQLHRQEIQNKIPAWVQATNGLSSFVRRHLHPTPEADTESQPPLVGLDARELRVDGFQFEELTITYDKRKAVLTPLSLEDEKSGDVGGRAVLRAENGSIVFDLLWDGKSHEVKDHWQIVQTAGGSKANRGKQKPFTGESLDEALKRLFGLIVEV